MKGKIYKKGLAVLLGLTLAANLPVTSPLSIHMLDSYAYTGAATVKASSLNVRSDAGTGYSAVARLAAGASIQITGEKKGTDGKTWYRIQYTGSNGQAGTGYVSAAYEDDIQIVKTKKFAMKPVNPEEACLQMEMLGHNFFVFLNSETEQVNVVYKRKNGTYGLIEPEF